MNERKPDDSPLPPSELLSLDHSQLYMRRKLTSSDSNLSVYNFDLLSDENPHIPEDNAPLQGSFSSIVDTYNNLEYTPNSITVDMSQKTCSHCKDGFSNEKIVNTNGELWHTQCFVCAQCFRPFPEGIYYEFEGRKYCEHDFQVLFAPYCGKCGRPIEMFDIFQRWIE